MVLPETRWHHVGDPATPHEDEALEAVRQLLADDPLCHAWANVTFIDRSGSLHEMDVLLLLATGLFVVELKGWSGRITGRQNDWRQRPPLGADRHFPSPVVDTDKKAKHLRALLDAEAVEAGSRFRIPFVHPVVVMHGRGSRVELSHTAPGPVYGLDGYSVAGVPNFSELLKEPGRRARLTKPDADAVVRLIESSGLAPRVAPPSTGMNSDHADERRSSVAPPADVLFDELSDEQLMDVGVKSDQVEAVRAGNDLESLIGRVPDPVWDDLESLAAGEEVDLVVERRQAAERLLNSVDDQAADVGWSPEVTGDSPLSAPLPAVQVESAPRDDPAPHDVGAEPEMTELEEQLRSAFGDRVTGGSRRHKRRATSRLPSPAPAPSASTLPEPHTESLRLARRTRGERLLALARSEAGAGRLSASRALLSRVRLGVENDLRTDWLPSDIESLCRDLADHPHLVRQIVDLPEPVADEADLGGRAIATMELQRGAIWLDAVIGPAYSLLVRLPDVVDRSSGVFLSQVIGREAAARVNADLRIGRPDGGRIRVVPGGIVVSRRDATSPWFVVGSVEATSWFDV